MNFVCTQRDEAGDRRATRWKIAGSIPVTGSRPMRKPRGVSSTAGFESVWAAYLKEETRLLLPAF